MDTLGTIRPTTSGEKPNSQRMEAVERLRYLGLQGRCGILVGRRGVGKSALLVQMQSEFRTEGLDASLIPLAGMTGHELPHLLAAELGVGLEPNADRLSVWAALQDYAVSAEQAGLRQILMFDQLERSDSSVVPVFERLLSLFHGAFACLFASRPKLAKPFKTLMKNHSWMQVELSPLAEPDVSQAFARHVAKQGDGLVVSQAAASAANNAAKGRLDQLQRLAELAALAAEAEGMSEIDHETIQALSKELLR